MLKIYATTKLTDIVQQDESLIPVLARLGIRPGFGEATISDVCKTSGLQTEFLLCLLNTMINEHYDPAEMLRTFTILQLIEYLQQENNHFRGSLQHLQAHINMLCHSAQNTNLDQLQNMFSIFQENMLKLLLMKEQHMYPAMVHTYEVYYSPGLKKKKKDPIDYQEETQDVIKEIAYIRNFIIQNTTGTYNEALLYGVLNMFSRLEKEICRQQQIEERLLKKLITGIEENIDKKKNFVRNSYISLPARRDILSAREKEVLTLVAQGYINKEIAEKLQISLHTVLSHRKNIARKLSVKTISGLTTYAIANGLIEEKTL